MFEKLFGSKSKTARGADVRFASILTPVDMRHPEDSEKAIAVAAGLSRAHNAPYAILTVARPLGDEITEMPEAHEPEFVAFVEAAERKHGVSITPVFRSHESPIKVITDVSRERGTELIVMASHDPRFTDHIFGSNASQIALHAPCSVLVVR